MSEPFEWNPEKERANVAKHGITFAEAQSVFLDPFVYMAPDDGHSREEDRFTALGISQQHRLVFVVYAERGECIRIISARPATRREKRAYEG
jgi:uncharacterized DUF497 family protein